VCILVHGIDVVLSSGRRMDRLTRVIVEETQIQVHLVGNMLRKYFFIFGSKVILKFCLVDFWS